jgi:hypothetical protein
MKASPTLQASTWRARTLASALAALMLASSCGMILFPERKGQDSGKLDPNVIVMDASLLIFWIVPGVVAFVVDFATGAGYLPPGVTKGEGPLFGDDALFDVRAGETQPIAVELPAGPAAGVPE